MIGYLLTILFFLVPTVSFCLFVISLVRYIKALKNKEDKDLVNKKKVIFIIFAVIEGIVKLTYGVIITLLFLGLANM